MEIFSKATTPIKILVIDDDEDIREALTQVLEYEGFVVATAANGQEGLAYLKSSKPSLILLDLMMPIMDGWEFQSEIKRNPEMAQIPVVVLSADGEDKKSSRDLQAAGFLKKPIPLETLVDAVRQYSL